MVRSMEQAPIHLSLEEVTVRASHEVLMEVDNNILLLIDEGNLDQQLLIPATNHIYDDVATGKGSTSVLTPLAQLDLLVVNKTLVENI